MHFPKLVEALSSPSELVDLVDAIPVAALRDGLERRLDTDGDGSLEAEHALLSMLPIDSLKAELIRRGQLSSDVGVFMSDIETQVADSFVETGDEAQTRIKRLLHAASTCVTATKTAHERAIALRSDAVALADNMGLSRREIGEVAGVSVARVQQLIEAIASGDPAK
jgi:hypothetical protein